MSEAIKAAREMVQQYDKDKDLTRLQTAGEKMESVDPFAAPASRERAEIRLQAMSTWALILSRVDAALPNVDPNDPPVTRVRPRTPPGMRTYPPGVDPKQIADPQIRAEYEQAIENNQRKAALTQRYWQVKALDTEVSEAARRFVRRFYTSAPVDQNELREILEKAGLGAQRRRQLAAPPK